MSDTDATTTDTVAAPTDMAHLTWCVPYPGRFYLVKHRNEMPFFAIAGADHPTPEWCLEFWRATGGAS